MSLFKNVASQKFAVYAYDTTIDVGKTGDAANITAEISLDGAASAPTNDVNPAELEATDHPGIYVFDLTQAETNADLIVISAVSGTANIVIVPSILYPAIQQTGDAFARAGAPAGASLAADIAAVLAAPGAVTIPELAQGVPPVTPTEHEALAAFWMTWRNKLNVQPAVKEIRNDAGVVIAKKVLSGDATNYDEAKMISGP